MPLDPQALVADVITEVRGVGTGPWTVFNLPNVTSGEVYAKITEANAMLQQWTGIGSSTPTDAQAVEAIKRYETNYASAKLVADLIGVIATDGFNITTGGTAIQRFSAEFQTYQKFIKDHLDLSNMWLKALHPWFFDASSATPEGFNEFGYPVWYWSVSQAMW